MAGRITGRNAAWIGLIGVAAVAIVAGLQWRALATQLFVGRLRAEPQLLLEYWAKAPGDPRRDAVARFVAEPAGGSALLRLWIQAGVKGDGEPALLTATGKPPADVWAALKDADAALFFTLRAAYVGEQRGGFAAEWPQGSAMVLMPAAAPRQPEELLGLIAGRELRIPDYPDLRFRVLPFGEATSWLPEHMKWARSVTSELLPFVQQLDAKEGAGAYACLAHRRDAPQTLKVSERVPRTTELQPSR